MPNRIATDDDWDDSEDDYNTEWEPDEEDNIDHLLGDDEEPTIECPHCRKQMYEESEKCPNCGEYISLEDSKRIIPGWIVVTCVILMLFIGYFWIF